ncbi:MAG: DUF4982 domain-containing protein [Paludibacter sp.]|nr:DUF4982 domain-containing protein [Bacteroidales bacterium]MCM1069096.1 DUF4982 domain-containing protein [Prevotella sp.]MCM1353535.1 DUF4982 domain-containing protein [Bacteroides sp.]MCM1442696.1 DUF4982 domain-containing protein [Muribaculum sp.]MCM1481668.1 DUF4982 domain-containing protein [Paludibacter sp.]
MKNTLIGFMLLLAATCVAQRQETLLTQWEFAKETDLHILPQQGWKQVCVPHDWAIAGPFDRNNDLQTVAITQNFETTATAKTGRTGGLPYIGAAWYKTTLPTLQYQHTELLFDGAMSEAEVYINGHKVIFWAYGYNAFHVDITPYLRPDNNEVWVRLQNLPESSRWYPGAGLFRNVHLVETADVHVPIWGTHITTPYVSQEMASIRIQTTIDNCTNRTVRIVTHIRYQGITVDSLDNTYHIRHQLPIEQNFSITNPQLWAPETPNLYEAVSYIYCDNQLQDTYSTRFGIRSIEIVPNVGFLLNGKVRKFKGVCNHHDLGPLGAAVNKSALRHQLQMLQEMGCDAIRTSHNMPAPELVELCDEMGFMMMVEPFDEWDVAKCKNGYHRYFHEWAEADMVNMLHHFRNNPSVVMWSIGNEVPTQCSADGYRVALFLQNICQREDGTRPITCGMDQVSCVLENGFASVIEVVGLNYRTFRYQEAYNRTPQRLVLGSETASTVSSRGIYKLPVRKQADAKYTDNQSSAYDVEYCAWSNLPDEDFALQDDYPWTIGQFVWTGFDYLGEPSPYDTDAWPSHSSYFGIIDLASIPKDRYWLYRSQWNNRQHTLHILPHWNWQSGDTVPVFVYTDAPEAELFLNGKSLGKQHKLTATEAAQDTAWGVQRRYRLIWDNVPYEAGELKAVTTTGQTIVRTAGKPHHIELRADFISEDLNYINVRIVDKDGNLCPMADNLVHFKVSGTGEFRAAANGDATCTYLFHQPQHPAFCGQLTAIVQGTGTLTATAKGLKSATLVINNN